MKRKERDQADKVSLVRYKKVKKGIEKVASKQVSSSLILTRRDHHNINFLWLWIRFKKSSIIGNNNIGDTNLDNSTIRIRTINFSSITSLIGAICSCFGSNRNLLGGPKAPTVPISTDGRASSAG